LISGYLLSGDLDCIVLDDMLPEYISFEFDFERALYYSDNCCYMPRLNLFITLKYSLLLIPFFLKCMPFPVENVTSSPTIDLDMILPFSFQLGYKPYLL